MRALLGLPLFASLFVFAAACASRPSRPPGPPPEYEDPPGASAAPSAPAAAPTVTDAGLLGPTPMPTVAPPDAGSALPRS